MRDKRTPKDVCGEATIHKDVLKKGLEGRCGINVGSMWGR